VCKLQVEANQPHAVRAMVSSQRQPPAGGAVVDGVPSPREQNSGEQPQEGARTRVVRGSSVPTHSCCSLATGTHTLRLTPRLTSPRIVAAGDRRPVVPASRAATAGQEDGRSPHIPGLALCEWMQSRAPEAQESSRRAQSHPCSRGCTPLRQRTTTTWSTPCSSCASSGGVPVACWLAPSILAPQQPQMVVQSSGGCYRDAVPQWPLSVRGPVVAPPLAAWSGVPAPHGSTSLVPTSPLSPVAAPCSGCAGLRPPPGLPSCLLTLPPAWLQPPKGLGVPVPPRSP